ncbi:MAG TPA: GDSL-type esterase/lipase family protein, partial [Bacteroidales bacterium]
QSFLDTSQNFIRNTQNSLNWARFTNKMECNLTKSKTSVTIVHMGDSHIQGGYFTNRVRELLDKKYRIQGRGFVFPYTLLKANGPEDVKFYSLSRWLGQKYNHIGSKEKAGIGGYSLLLNDEAGAMSISLQQGSGTRYPFQKLVVYHENSTLQVSVRDAISCKLDTITPTMVATRFSFNSPRDSVILRFKHGSVSSRFYGIELQKNEPGLVYHSVGVNGASFESYVNSIDYIPMLKALHPDCIIISLGTNDAYLPRLDTTVLKNRIQSVIRTIRQEIPETAILFTTPGDHLLHKKDMNKNLERVRSVIISTAIEQQCAYWDFFSVMGGLGGSIKWSENGFMFRDMLHLSKEGYKLQGDLFFEAFDKAMEGTTTNH